MKHYSKIVLALAVAVFATSCSDTETDTKSTQGFSNCYAIITDSHTGDVTVSEPVTVGMMLNWTQQTAEVAYSGLTIGGSTYPQMSLTGLKWTSNNLWGYMTTKDPVVTLATGQQADVTDFTYMWSDRMDMPGLGENTYDPAFAYSFTIDGRYKVAGSRSPFSLWGTTTASAEGVADFTSTVTNIVATPDFKKGTISIVIKEANFASNMPKLEIELPSIPMQYADGGSKLTFAVASLTPQMGGAPVPGFPVSNVSGTIDPQKGMDLQFGVVAMGTRYVVTTHPTYFGYRDDK